MLFHPFHYHYPEYDRKNFVLYPTKDQVHFVVLLYNLDYLDHLNKKRQQFGFRTITYLLKLPLISSTGKPTKDDRFLARAEGGGG
jgi:hypothetical protein